MENPALGWQVVLRLTRFHLAMGYPGWMALNMANDILDSQKAVIL